MISPLQWQGDRLSLLDQTVLPDTLAYREYSDWQSVIEAIQSMVVRGAPAIGIAGGYALALAALDLTQTNPSDWKAILKDRAKQIANARPTAVNLSWAIETLQTLIDPSETAQEAFERIETAARMLQVQDLMVNKRIGENGEPLFKSFDNVMTVCNTGSLATAGYGTALGVIRAAHDKGRQIHVWVTETRPRLQGMRLTAWELSQEKIPYTLVTDNMAAHLMKEGKVDSVIAGADRIAANGDTANKIGTYSLAVLAHYHQIPFYIAAPLSTIDLQLPGGHLIPIEQRPDEEITHLRESRIAPEGAKTLNPAFDVTPANLISAIITEQGVVRAPYETNLGKLFEQD